MTIPFTDYIDNSFNRLHWKIILQNFLKIISLLNIKTWMINEQRLVFKRKIFLNFLWICTFSNTDSYFSSLGVGEQFNEKTSFLDASNIYGNSKASISICRRNNLNQRITLLKIMERINEMCNVQKYERIFFKLNIWTWMKLYI